MPEFKCLCGYKTTVRTSINKHLNKQKKCGKYTQTQLNNILYICNICNKKYNNIEKHNTLHSVELQQLQQIHNLQEQIDQIKHLSAQSAHPRSGLSVQPIIQPIIQNNIQINIFKNLKDYRDCDLSHVTEQELLEKLKDILGNEDSNNSDDYVIATYDFTYFHHKSQYSAIIESSKDTLVYKNNNFEKIPTKDFLHFLINNKLSSLIRKFSNFTEDFLIKNMEYLPEGNTRINFYNMKMIHPRTCKINHENIIKDLVTSGNLIKNEFKEEIEQNNILKKQIPDLLYKSIQ